MIRKKSTPCIQRHIFVKFYAPRTQNRNGFWAKIFGANPIHPMYAFSAQRSPARPPQPRGTET
ncbi:hypothetical protein BC936DRAFT_140361 [Jimgerdemannia flammicorona]|uniref:Uncharacterized protein n=1 Tax=Jimgerdemannia flammicorona TaxID=994334 RepID=A0A433DH08_9FUNG|nr:hypothetical protein BC936DRAFT_140361 [Jimgerdemannia flammicorona]